MARFLSAEWLATLTSGLGLCAQKLHIYMAPLSAIFLGALTLDNDDTAPGALSSGRPKRRGPVFDWTVNLGHLLTFIGFVGLGFAAFQTLDKRVVVLEQQQAYTVQRDIEMRQQAQLGRAEIREAVRDVQQSITRLDDRLQTMQMRQVDRK